MTMISDEKIQAAVAAVTQLQSDLQPDLRPLSANERRSLPKMGDGSVAFVEKAHEYAKTYSNLVPSFLDVTELTANLGLYTQLQTLSKLLNPLASSLSDAMLLTGSNAYTAALAFYRNVKNAQKMNIQNAKVINDDLSQRFANIRQSPVEPTATTETPVAA